MTDRDEEGTERFSQVWFPLFAGRFSLHLFSSDIGGRERVGVQCRLLGVLVSAAQAVLPGWLFLMVFALILVCNAVFSRGYFSGM